jgi:hypothetical protein
MKLMQDTRSIFQGFDPWRKAEWALGLLSLISSCFAVSVVPFLRRDMGERYFGWLNLFFGYTVVANFTFLFSVFFHGPSQLMTLFWAAFIAASLYQRYQIAQKNTAGQQWHSMYMGTSLLPLPMSPEKIFKFVEPAAVYLAGHFLSAFSSAVGWWLTFAAAGLFVNNHIVFFNERQAILDMRDAQIESKFLSAALSGKPAQETAGLVVSESSIKLMGQDASLKEAFAHLSTDLKQLLDSEERVEGQGTRVEE